MNKKTSFIGKIFSRVRNKSNPEIKIPDRFDVLGLETSYACNFKCRMCPRFYIEEKPGFLSTEQLIQLKPVLQKFRYACLTGYGETLMNPHFPEQIKFSRENVSHVSFITNGYLLKGNLLDKIIDAGTDEIGISIDAGKAETYEYVRQKGVFSNLIKNLNEIKIKFANLDKKPVLQWIYVIMKYNMEEVFTAVNIAADMGFDKFTIKHMESAQSKDDLKDALFNTGIAPDLSPDEEKRFSDIIASAKESVATKGIALTVHPRKFEISGACLVNPLNSIYIDYKGNVSACCYLNVLKVMPYNIHKPKWNGVIGNVFETAFEEILKSENYIDFRQKWSAGIPPDCCVGCLQVQRMRLPQD